MSRIGRSPIPIPSGVSISVVDGNVVMVKGPKGELQQAISGDLTVRQEESTLFVERPDNLREHRSQHGLARTLINNMVVGVTQGHSKSLDIVGVGYRAQMEGRNLLLNMGYSHPVRIAAAPGITFELISNDKARTQQIKVSGIDRQLVGQMAADVRKVRKPEPYKGKGIRYSGEIVRLKAGKRAAAVAKK
ncbi:MAG: 50S ribosomal protein L6 [Fimbriimonas ginsengisoli]|uniref:Large ribosomal subunit protein uL6 n=1 Tax=Fimbriimonas ginsengisoli TaxID=1005039 RepID=A0A931LUM8_FIMGI|nr:50S ribosomal protein L6 [Fimbriimonas ginsengisoli]